MGSTKKCSLSQSFIALPWKEAVRLEFGLPNVAQTEDLAPLHSLAARSGPAPQAEKEHCPENQDLRLLGWFFHKLVSTVGQPLPLFRLLSPHPEGLD